MALALVLCSAIRPVAGRRQPQAPAAQSETIIQDCAAKNSQAIYDLLSRICNGRPTLERVEETPPSSANPILSIRIKRCSPGADDSKVEKLCWSPPKGSPTADLCSMSRARLLGWETSSEDHARNREGLQFS